MPDQFLSYSSLLVCLKMSERLAKFTFLLLPVLDFTYAKGQQVSGKPKLVSFNFPVVNFQTYHPNKTEFKKII